MRLRLHPWLRYAALVAMVAAFWGSRAALLVSSSSANQNWEEPVFLFSSLELQRAGLARVWDYQDDLDHGGSVPLIVLGSLWLQWQEPSVVSLKWLVLLWWTATVCAYLWVLASLFSWRAALVGGAMWLGLSPNLARLQITIVGSHPEGVLPALCATALLVCASRACATSWFLSFSTALLAAAAAWMSYLLVPWALPVVGALIALSPRWPSVSAVTSGVALGALPWIYQNVCRHPYRWWQWIERAFPSDAATHPTPHLPALGMLNHLSEAWGGAALGSATLAALILLALLLAVALLSRLPRRAVVRSPLAVGVLFAAAVLSTAALVVGRISPLPNEGYYFARFFVPLAVLLLVLAAGGIDVAAQAWGARIHGLAVALALAVSAYQLAPLYGQGAARSDFREEWLRGCLVFGVAEYPRAGSAEGACARLRKLDDPTCRERAFNGIGWSVADEYLRRGTLEPAYRAVACAGEPPLRRAVCGGMRFVFARSPQGAREFPPELAATCQP
ncbi:MAG: hypothetical protein N3C12_05385 [Candidatus Binatia bacterium]|nr:hypothetical protein [Candidatus Binatia bacterium]